MRLFLVLTLVVVFAVASGAAAQPAAKPTQLDFSGSWTLQEPENAPPTIATALIVKQTITDRTVYGKPMTPFYSGIEIERRFGTVTRFEKHPIGIIGGTVGGIREDGTQVADSTHFSNLWNGDRLVLKTETYSSPARDSAPTSSHQETWSFDANGRLIVVVTDQSSGFEPKTWTLVCRRF